MSKKYHLDQNEVAFLHCINSAFAAIFMSLELIQQEGKRVPKKKLIQAIQNTLSSTNTMLSSEYIRGELIKKGVLENGDNTGLCTFDPSVDNENSETEVFTKDELLQISLEQQEPTWKTTVKGR